MALNYQDWVFLFFLKAQLGENNIALLQLILAQQSNSDICELNEAQRCSIVDKLRNCSVLCVLEI